MWKLIQALSTDLFKVPRFRGDDGKQNPRYDEQSYLWRLKILSILITVTAVIAFHLVEVHGFGIGDGFASNEVVKDIQISQLEERMDKYQTILCMRPGTPEIIELMRELQTKYEKLTGHRYEPLNCELLLQINA